MKKIILSILSILVLCSCIEKKETSTNRKPIEKVAGKAQFKQGNKKNKGSKSTKGSLMQVIRQSSSFDSQDLSVINSINNEFKPKLAKTTKVNKGDLLKKKNARLKKNLGDVKYAKYRYCESKFYGLQPKNKMDPINIQNHLNVSDAQMYRYIGVLHSKNNAKNKQSDFKEIFGVKNFKKFIEYRK